MQNTAWHQFLFGILTFVSSSAASIQKIISHPEFCPCGLCSKYWGCYNNPSTFSSGAPEHHIEAADGRGLTTAVLILDRCPLDQLRFQNL